MQSASRGCIFFVASVFVQRGGVLLFFLWFMRFSGLLPVWFLGLFKLSSKGGVGGGW